MEYNSIAPSELIITESGCIYHLDVHPEELADTIITVGDPGRVPEVSKYFDRIEHKKSHREFVTHTGYIGNKRISAVSTGIGPDNIDIVMNELDALVNIDFESRSIKAEKKSLNILRMGTSGSLQADVEVDSLVAGSFGIGLDNLMLFYPHSHTNEEQLMLGEFIQHTCLSDTLVKPYMISSSIQLLNHFVEGYHQGIIVTCPGFYGPQGRILRLPLAFPNLVNDLTTFRYNNVRITNFEMETSAIYALGKLMGHHCLSINTIVANRVNKTFSKDSGKSIDNMIRKSLEILAAL